MDMVHIHDAHSVDALREGSDPKDPETPVRPVPSSTLCGGPGLFFRGFSSRAHGSRRHVKIPRLRPRANAPTYSVAALW